MSARKEKEEYMGSYSHLMLNRYDVEIDNPSATPKTLTAFKYKAAIAYVERIMRDIYDTPIPATNAHKVNEDGSLLVISNLVINSNRHGHARISHEMSITSNPDGTGESSTCQRFYKVID